MSAASRTSSSIWRSTARPTFPRATWSRSSSARASSSGPTPMPSTGFDTTTYMLDLPKADAEHIDTALFLFREVASELKFDPAAVDRERGVILGEERARDNFQLHQVVDMVGFEVPRDALSQPPSDRCRRGSEDRVGGHDPQPLSPLLPSRECDARCSSAMPTLRSSKPRSRRRSPTGRASAPPVRRSRAARSTSRVPPRSTPSSIPQSRRPSITPSRGRGSDPADTIAERHHKIVEALATAMFNRRLQKLINAAGLALARRRRWRPTRSATPRWSRAVTVVAKDGDWKDALDAAEQEVRRAVEHGFTAAELKTEIAEHDRRPARRRRAGRTRARTSRSSNAILGVVGRDKFVTTPEVRGRRVRCDWPRRVTPAR